MKACCPQHEFDTSVNLRPESEGAGTSKLALIENSGSPIEALSESWLLEELDQHGALLFRGFDVDRDCFHRFAGRFNKVFVTQPYGDRASYDDQPGLQSVPLGKSALGPHFEWGSSPFRPDLLWFCCETPARQGGETTLFDGSEVFKHLSSESRRRLTEQAVLVRDFFPLPIFKRILDSDMARAVLGAEPLRRLSELPHLALKGVTADNRLVIESRLSAVSRKPGRPPALRHNLIAGHSNHFESLGARVGHADVVLWEDGSPLDDSIIEDIQRACRAVRLDVRWQAGDVLMIDNNWVMHGRNAWDGSPREIVTLASISRWHEAHRDQILDADIALS